MDVSSLMRTGGQRLLAAGFVSGPAEARILLGCAMDATGAQLSRGALMGDDVPTAVAARYETLLTGRLAGTPVQHLTGSAPFRYLDLDVGPGVFIPRPETELVVQAVLDFLDTAPPDSDPDARDTPDAPVAVADLCSGSGAVAIALATERAHTRVTAVDLSSEAMAYAERNVERYGPAASAIGSSVELVADDVLTFTGGPFTAIASNPPYVPVGQETAEVAAGDPAMALYGGGADGMHFPLALIARAPGLLMPGGLFAMEHAESQADATASAFSAAGLTRVAGHADYTGRIRFTTGRRPHGHDDWRRCASGAHLRSAQ